MNMILFIIIISTTAVLSFLLSWIINNIIGKRSIRIGQMKASAIIKDAEEESSKTRKVESVKLKEELIKQKVETEEKIRKKVESLQNFEQQIQQRHVNVKNMERSIQDRTKNLEKEKKQIAADTTRLQGKEKELIEKLEECDRRLERIAGLTVEDAKKMILANLKKDAEHEAANYIRTVKEEAQRTAEMEAQKIITLAIERVAIDQVPERTTSVVKIPDDKIKGHLIGHEGKNIKIFERVTGVQLIINEDPETVVLSAFNPVAREIAKQTLEKIIQSGNINPNKIQEAATKARKRVYREIIQTGEQAFRDLKLPLPHPEIAKLVGKLKYRTSYGQNVLKHSIEVAQLADSIASELKLDGKLARRAGLLHDIGKAIDFNREGTHPQLGGEAARQYREHEFVINAIESHHEDVEVIHPIPVIVAACDAISGSRPGARRASLSDYLKRIEALENIANSFEGVEQSFAIQAGRELRVIVSTEKIDDSRLNVLANEMARKIQSEMDFPGHIKVTMIREMKAVEYAG